MTIDFTPIARPIFEKRARRTDKWHGAGDDIQLRQLKYILKKGAETETGRKYDYNDLLRSGNIYKLFSQRIPLVEYEDIRSDVMRMIRGEKDILWPGVCRNFAQSSGTSGGKSKYIPITDDSLRLNHYPGASDSVAHYLRHNPSSKIFSGKGLILGGSFANELKLSDSRVRVGDVSATLINHIPEIANLFRTPSKKIALMPDWEKKLPAIITVALKENVTNLSGVPSWFLTLLRKAMETVGATNLAEIWPNLEVFFHGGISFEPYREEYRQITDSQKMHFVETYNASEGFFAVQDNPDDKGMLLGIDEGVFYEFFPIDGSEPVPYKEVEKDKIYELVITSCNGLLRYRLGDTVKVMQTDPVKIIIEGRTKCYINAFGEELMQDNAERAIAEACRRFGAQTENYTVAPYYASNGKRGHHQWLIEWEKRPGDMAAFAQTLDDELRKLNSDYDAKRKGGIFLDPLEIIDAPVGTFDHWLQISGNHKLGGQRKIPRLSNDRTIFNQLGIR